MADGCLQLLEQERRMPMHLCFKHARTCVKVSEVSPGCQHNHGVGLFHTMSPMPQNVTQWQATRTGSSDGRGQKSRGDTNPRAFHPGMLTLHSI
eukprot:1151182-Pelagomonas_calceolata.AAC.5